MAVLFCDSFDHYTTTTQAGFKWTAVTGTNNGSFGVAGSGRNGTFGFHAVSGAGGTNTLRKSLGATHATLIAGAGWQHHGGSVDPTVIALDDVAAGGEQLSVRYSVAQHKLYVSRNGTLLATGATVFSDSVYYFIELRATIHNTAGAYEVRINGTTELLASGANTRGVGTNNSADAIRIGPVGSTNVYDADWDDFYCCDDSGAANNTFLGDVAVQCLFPNGDGANLQWTPSTGVTHSTLVDETSPNGDTDYVSDATAGDRDSYSYDDLRASTGAVLAVQVLIYARKDDAGTRQIAPVVRISATNYDGATLPNLGTTYTWYSAIYETSPASATAWTVSEVNAAEFGVKLVA